MRSYENAINTMEELFSRDYQFALATSANNVPSLRFVDTYFDSGFFYIVTYATSQKVREITVNPSVVLRGRRIHIFNGKAYNIGHPLKPENSEIRSKLIKAFEPWYFKHNSEDDENMCYLKIEPTTGFFHKDGIGYEMDFTQNKVSEFPFTFDTVITED